MLLSSATRASCGSSSPITSSAPIAPDGELEPIRGLANKLPEHAARLAAVLTLVQDIDAGEILAADMEAGIALAEHYAGRSVAAVRSGRINADLRLAQRLLDWLLGTWGEPAISLPDIYQRSLNAIGDKATAAKLVAILEDHGWLVTNIARRGGCGATPPRRMADRAGADDGRLSQVQRHAAKPRLTPPAHLNQLKHLKFPIRSADAANFRWFRCFRWGGRNRKFAADFALERACRMGRGRGRTRRDR